MTSEQYEDDHTVRIDFVFPKREFFFFRNRYNNVKQWTSGGGSSEDDYFRPNRYGTRVLRGRAVSRRWSRPGKSKHVVVIGDGRSVSIWSRPRDPTKTMYLFIGIHYSPSRDHSIQNSNHHHVLNRLWYVRYTGPLGFSIQQVCAPGSRRVGKHDVLYTSLWNVETTHQILVQTISGADEILLRLLSRV